MAMSAEHKAALAAGRRESRAIKDYLEALASRRPGRPVTPDTLAKRVKDLGSAAVFVSLIIAAVVWGSILWYGI